jgi:hypothetical protein
MRLFGKGRRLFLGERETGKPELRNEEELV